MSETKPSRHWFRFGLRTLFVTVAIMAAACAWLFAHLKWIRDRQEARVWISEHSGFTVDDGDRFSLSKSDGTFVVSDDGVAITNIHGEILNDLPRAPISLRLFGEKSAYFIGFGNFPNEVELESAKVRLRQLFPEAEFIP
jgi:hypothetical protein